MVHLIQARRGLPADARVQVFAYLNRAFAIPMVTVMKIGSWVGFGGEGAMSDQEVDGHLQPSIDAWLDEHS
ncbi:MAG: hypothetical protein ACT4QF_23905 [Sporichthyaceae bacterium]